MRAVKLNPLEPKRIPSWDIDYAFWTSQGADSRNFVEIIGESFRSAFVQNIRTLLEMNYEQRKNSDENWNKHKDWKHVGRIPYSVYLEWQRLGITEDPKALLRALELNKEFKTTEKRL